MTRLFFSSPTENEAEADFLLPPNTLPISCSLADVSATLVLIDAVGALDQHSLGCCHVKKNGNRETDGENAFNMEEDADCHLFFTFVTCVFVLIFAQKLQ